MRRLSQVFLRDRTYTERIIQEVSPKPDDLFFEVGPGEGALTGVLLERGSQVVAVELDIVLADRLARELAQATGDRLKVVHGNYLRLSVGPLLPKTPARFISNLPYHISTPTLEKLVNEAGLYADAHLTLQKEVAERIRAKPGTKTYGYISVLVNLRYDPELLFYIPPGAFSLAPRVTSVFLRLRKRKFVAPDEVIHKAARLAWAGFRSRRRATRNTLRPMLGDGILEILGRAGIDPNKRADQLSPEEYLEVARAEVPF